MEVSVKIRREEKSVILDEGSTINDLLKKLGINRETVLIRRNGKLCIEEEVLNDRDSVEIIPAISGG
jgi:sulfur carrier protein ThiS